MEAEVRSAADGGLAPLVKSDGALWLGQVHGRFTLATARRKNIFMAANPGTQALSVNNTTATGIIISNPPESNMIIALIDVCVALASLPAGQSALILTGSDTGTVTHTTPLTVRSGFMNDGGGAKALVDSAATIPTPAVRRVIGGGPAATVAASTSFPPFIESNIEGKICLAPGANISLQALTTAITVVASICWEEIPVVFAT